MDYWACRRALRIRPVGSGEDKEEALKFMRDHLKLDESFLRCVSDLQVERIPYGPKSKIRDEMLIRFRTVEARDVVRGAATNLAGLGPNYGIRLEIANHMKTDMKALQAVSYDIKQRHRDARRNVLFDDDSMELVLDFCLSEGAAWKRLTAGQARSRKRQTRGPTARAGLDEGELDEILGAQPMAQE